jgi:alanine dehydrogenase
MEIGIPKETKKNETRIALIPRDVRKIIQAGHQVSVEQGAGEAAGFPDEQYEEAGARIVDDVWDKEMIVKVKALPTDPFRDSQIFFAYLHVEKGQSPELLKRLLERNVTGYAFEEIRDVNGVRQVNLGHEAGLVGMYEGLRTYGKMLEENRKVNPFRILPDIRQISKKEAYGYLSEIEPIGDIQITVMGYGNVYHGVQEILDEVGIEPLVLTEAETPHMERYLPDCDILVNAVTWVADIPPLVSKDMLKLMKKSALILDISCDEEGAVESCIPTTWSRPTYRTEGILHSCIDNLPTAIAMESSIHLSRMVLPFVLKVADGKGIGSGLMVKQGRIMYRK